MTPSVDTLSATQKILSTGPCADTTPITFSLGDMVMALVQQAYQSVPLPSNPLPEFSERDSTGLYLKIKLFYNSRRSRRLYAGELHLVLQRMLGYRQNYGTGNWDSFALSSYYLYAQHIAEVPFVQMACGEEVLPSPDKWEFGAFLAFSCDLDSTLRKLMNDLALKHLERERVSYPPEEWVQEEIRLTPAISLVAVPARIESFTDKTAVDEARPGWQTVAVTITLPT